MMEETTRLAEVRHGKHFLHPMPLDEI
jgi:hypothetical protein